VPADSIDDIRDADRATTELLRVLRVHKAPAVAFVTEGRLDVQGETDARIALLKRWVDAGIVLGNHTYSHADLNELTVDQFQQEIIRGEVVTRRLMESRQHYQLYFRQAGPAGSRPCGGRSRPPAHNSAAFD
jgi:peptidoglycan/xylan/chitin deacetylase (PgdA/CDA1 family)